MIRFLAAEAPLEGAAVAIQGLPYDGGVSFRAGSAEGPRAIREMSDSLESYSPLAGSDLEDLAIHDAGDLDLAGLEAKAVMDVVAESTARLAASAGLVVSLGGDHSLSIGVAAGMRRRHPGLAHVVFDAHMDMRPAYDGSEFSHACGTWHMSGAGPTVLLGVRSGSREEWETAPGRLAAMSTGLSMPPEGRAALQGRPVHISLDIDVIDAGALPGVGNPEAGGPSFGELRDALCSLTWANVVALDVLEVTPSLDPSGVSASAAAKLVRELVCARAR